MRQLAALLVPVLLMLPGVGTASSSDIRVGGSAKDFTLETLDGASVRFFEQLGNEATVVVFWATWSPRSAEVMADVQNLYQTYGPEHLRVIAVNVEHEGWDPSEEPKVVAATRDAGATYPVVLDKDLSIFSQYGFTVVPSSVLTDSKGRVVAALQGYSDMGRTAFREKVLETLGVNSERGPEVPVPAYKPKGQAGLNLRMGELLWSKGRRHDGLIKAMEAVAEDPAYCQAYDFLASALRFLGRDEEANRIDAQLSAILGVQVPPARDIASVAVTSCPN